MKQWVARVELVDDSQPVSFRAFVSLRDRHGNIEGKPTVFPKQGMLYKILKLRKGKCYALLRASRNRNAPVKFVREEVGPSW